MSEKYILHTKNGTKIIDHDEAIQYALDEEKRGVKPLYRYIYTVCGEKVKTPCGWLVWSTWQDGAAIVYRRECDGKPVLATGWQGDFCIG